MAVDKAKQDGRAEICTIIENQIKRLFKEFRNETGRADDAEFNEVSSDVSKSVVAEVLMGSEVKEQKICPEGGAYRAYVLMEMPIGPANEALVSQLKAHEGYYTAMKATDAFKELEDEIKAYEEWKKARGTGQTATDPTSPPELAPSPAAGSTQLGRRR